MKTLRKLIVGLAFIVGLTLAATACSQEQYAAAAGISFVIFFVTAFGVKSWSMHDMRRFAMLTFPFNEGGRAPLGARFTDRGCISCPTNYGYTPDSVLSTLEAATNVLLMEGVKMWRIPTFPLTDIPIREGNPQAMSNIRPYRYHAFYPDLHHTQFQNPTPDRQIGNITRELLQQCNGDLATARVIANANSLGCAPPRGARGLTGKDAYSRTAATATFELGPFCTTDYVELLDFQTMLDAISRAAVNGAGLALSYERIRQYVAMSRNNGVAIAGTTEPRFSQSSFDAIPDSPGSIEWLANAIDIGIGGEIDPGLTVDVHVSRQLYQYWLEKFMRDHDVDLRLDRPSEFRVQAQGFVAAFNIGAGGAVDFVMESQRTNRRIRITTSRTPIYIEMARNQDSAEWDFQPYFVTELGDDTDTGNANGFRQSMNTRYGDGCFYCEGQSKTLAEMILIYAPGSFHYETFPANPLRTRIPNVESNLQTLWGATEIMWHTGVEVDLYYLNEINTALAGRGFPCYNNKDKTWFAGRLKTGHQFVEDAPREMMALLVKVPTAASPIEKSACLLPCEPPAPITITNAPSKSPDLCSYLPPDQTPDDEAGCMLAPSRLQFNLPCVDAKEVTVILNRREGVDGALVVPFAVVNGTATEGAALPNQFNIVQGSVTFADGEDTAELVIALNPVQRGLGDPAYVNAILRWDNAPAVICGEAGATVDTKLCFKLCQQIAQSDADCPSGYAACDGVPNSADE